MKHAIILFNFIIAFFAAPPGFSGTINCVEGNGAPQTETRALSAFDQVSISGAFDVTIGCQKKAQVAVTADSNLLRYISTRVEKRTLIIDTQKPLCTRGPLSLNIHAPALIAVSLRIQ